MWARLRCTTAHRQRRPPVTRDKQHLGHSDVLCTSSTRAAIRQVKFRLGNGTHTQGLKDITIDSISEKKYDSHADMPLWGVEKLANATVDQMDPLWGLVSPEVARREDITTIQGHHLWVPGRMNGYDLGYKELNFAGIAFATRVLEAIFQVGNSVEDFTERHTGSRDAALYLKWLGLTNSTAGAESMLRLICTDLAANFVLGKPELGVRHATRWRQR